MRRERLATCIGLGGIVTIGKHVEEVIHDADLSLGLLTRGFLVFLGSFPVSRSNVVGVLGVVGVIHAVKLAIVGIVEVESVHNKVSIERAAALVNDIFAH